MKYVTLSLHKLYFIVGSISIFLGIETIARMYNWYQLFPKYDLLSHFLFGLSWYGIYFLWKQKDKQKLSKKGFFDRAFLSYIGVALFWEFLEKIGDTILFNTDYLMDIFFWDGFYDVVVGLIGLLFAYYILESRIK